MCRISASRPARRFSIAGTSIEKRSVSGCFVVMGKNRTMSPSARASLTPTTTGSTLPTFGFTERSLPAPPDKGSGLRLQSRCHRNRSPNHFFRFRISLDCRLKLVQQSVRHIIDSAYRAQIRLPHQTFIILNIKKDQTRLVALGDRHRMAKCLGDDITGLPGKIARRVRIT